jgi:hypothetical protein
LFTKLCTSPKDSIKAQADTCAKKSSKNCHLSGLNKVLASPKNPSSPYLAWVRATRKKYLTNPRKSHPRLASSCHPHGGGKKSASVTLLIRCFAEIVSSEI